MCLMHTDLPVPDGPRIIEIFPSGMPMLSPRRILLRPNALWTSTNSTASGTPVGRWAPVCHWYSSSEFPSRRDCSSRRLYPGSSSGRRSSVPCGCCWVSSLTVMSPWSTADGGARIGAPEELGAEHADEVHEHDVQDHGLRGRGPHPDRATARVVAVVAPDEHDAGGHRHALDHAV